jgi:hypothetical protein
VALLASGSELDVCVSRLSVAIPHVALRHITAPRASTSLSRTDVVSGEAAKGVVKGCGWHGMQGVRGSNPLSSTTTTPQVIASSLIQRRFLLVPGCPIRATRVPLDADGGASARVDAASISSSKAAAMAASRPAMTCW